MNIAHVMAGAPAGGAELFFERLVAAMQAGGDRVLPVIRRNQPRAERLARAGLHPAQLRFGGALDLLTPIRLGRLLRAFAPQVVVAWMNRAARATPRGDWVTVGRLGGFYDLRYYRGCAHLVANTRTLAAWIAAQGWPGERVHYLPNFVPDLAAPHPPSGAGKLLALGRLHRNKGFDVLIRALAELPDAQLTIAGEGPERPALEALARECGVAGRVRLPGWRQDTGSLLADCDLLVCPSRHEPLGNVVLEGFSAARPVVAAAVSGPSELIESGRTGLLVPPEDPAALASAMREVLADRVLAENLASAGRAVWAAEFAEAPVVARWRDALARMAPG